jgi:hypothetical protein
MERAETFKDASVEASDFRAVVTVLEDRHGNGEWRVEYLDEDGAPYVTIFAGPEARAPRARLFRRAVYAMLGAVSGNRGTIAGRSLAQLPPGFLARPRIRLALPLSGCRKKFPSVEATRPAGRTPHEPSMANRMS